jgi:hypothetical protein
MPQAFNGRCFNAEAGVDPGTAHVSFMVDMGAQRRNFLRILWFFTVFTSPPLLHTLLHFNTALTTRTSKQTVEKIEKKSAFSTSGSSGQEMLSLGLKVR